MTTIFAFIIVLGVLIFFHELGHFLVAKLSGVGVLKFSLGFGPALLKKQIGETEYILAAFPLGGYVKMVGDENIAEGKAEQVEIDPERSFSHKRLPVKAAIVAAGPIFNFVLAFIIFTCVAWSGVPSLVPTIGDIQPESPAYEAGLLKGDKVVSVDGKPVESWEDIKINLIESGAKQLSIIVERGGQQYNLKATPRMEEGKSIFGETVETPVLGIIHSGDVVDKRYGPINGIVYGGSQCWTIIKLTGMGFGKMISGEVDVKESLGGPIMIAQVSGQSFKAGIQPFMFLIAFISINLAIINLLPIPVLDGGYLLIFLIEGIIGKPLNDRPKEIAQQIGLFILIVIMLFAFYNDIMRVIGK